MSLSAEVQTKLYRAAGLHGTVHLPRAIRVKGVLTSYNYSEPQRKASADHLMLTWLQDGQRWHGACSGPLLATLLTHRLRQDDTFLRPLCAVFRCLHPASRFCSSSVLATVYRRRRRGPRSLSSLGGGADRPASCRGRGNSRWSLLA